MGVGSMAKSEKRHCELKPSKDRLVGGEPRLVMTYDEYAAWLEEEGNLGEWVDGELAILDGYTLSHQEVLIWLWGVLHTYLRRNGLGDLVGGPFIMWLELVRAARTPDLVVVTTPHLGRLTEERLVGPADIVVEVVSDETSVRDRREKVSEYAAAGVPE